MIIAYLKKNNNQTNNGYFDTHKRHSPLLREEEELHRSGRRTQERQLFRDDAANGECR